MAVEYSTGASIGETITVMVETDIIDVRHLRWRRDGAWDPAGPTGSSCFEQKTCGESNAVNSVVFDCYEAGSYVDQVHASMNVIVRSMHISTYIEV